MDRWLDFVESPEYYGECAEFSDRCDALHGEFGLDPREVLVWEDIRYRGMGWLREAMVDVLASRAGE